MKDKTDIVLKLCVPMMIVLGLLGTVVGTYQCFFEDDSREGLIDKTLVLSSPPKYFKPHKKSARYIFYAKDYSCRFLLTGNAYTLVKKYDNIRRIVEEIHEGDTIQISFSADRENDVYDASDEVPITGLMYKTVQVIPPDVVIKMNRESNKKATIISFAVFLFGVCMFAFRKSLRANDGAIPAQVPSPSPGDDHHAPLQNTPDQRSA